MSERILLDPAQIKPTLGRLCHEHNLRRMAPMFPAQIDDLEPVALVTDPDTGEHLLLDGNNRLVLATIYGVYIPAIIYAIGEILPGSEYDPELLITPRVIDIVREDRLKAEQLGFTDFQIYAQLHNLN